MGLRVDGFKIKRVKPQDEKNPMLVLSSRINYCMAFLDSGIVWTHIITEADGE